MSYSDKPLTIAVNLSPNTFLQGYNLSHYSDIPNLLNQFLQKKFVTEFNGDIADNSDVPVVDQVSTSLMGNSLVLYFSKDWLDVVKKLLAAVEQSFLKINNLYYNEELGNQNLASGYNTLNLEAHFKRHLYANICLELKKKILEMEGVTQETRHTTTTGEKKLSTRRQNNNPEFTIH